MANCKCGHTRGEHAEEQNYECLQEIRDGEQCECDGFQPEAAQPQEPPQHCTDECTRNGCNHLKVAPYYISPAPPSGEAPPAPQHARPETPQTPVDNSESADCNENCRKHSLCRERATERLLSELLQAAKDVIESYKSDGDGTPPTFCRPNIHTAWVKLHTAIAVVERARKVVGK